MPTIEFACANSDDTSRDYSNENLVLIGRNNAYDAIDITIPPHLGYPSLASLAGWGGGSAPRKDFVATPPEASNKDSRFALMLFPPSAVAPPRGTKLTNVAAIPGKIGIVLENGELIGIFQCYNGDTDE